MSSFMHAALHFLLASCPRSSPAHHRCVGLGWSFVFCSVLYFGPLANVQAAPSASGKNRPVLRLALLIGHNNAGGRASTLRYAESDARKVRAVLLQLAGYQAKHIWMVLGQPAAVVKRTMRSIQRKVKRLRQRVGKTHRIVLFVYYSGHAQKGHLLLGRSLLRFQALKQMMRAVDASLRLAVFDACESGALARTRGLRRRKDDFRFPSVRLAPSATGEVVITATGENESAHEDGNLHGGIFTHYLVSGLRGAADKNNDGQVTLQEAYLYAYNRALERTILSSKGPQRARFAKRLSGYGALVLTTLSKQRAWLQLHKNVRGEFFIWTPKKDHLLAEVVKSRGKPVTVALSPGQYLLQWRRRGGVYNQELRLQRGQRFRLGRKGKRLAYWKANGTRGVGGDSDAGLWKAFHGQLVGPGLGISYRAGLSALDQQLFHQGASLHFMLPLERVGSGRWSLFVQSSYQFGAASINQELRYDLHLVDLDLGLLWTLLERSRWWIGAGVFARGHMIVQSVHARPQRAAENLLSWSGGLGVMLSVQYGFAERWFVQFQMQGATRILDLGGEWALRWDLGGQCGIGLRL